MSTLRFAVHVALPVASLALVAVACSSGSETATKSTVGATTSASSSSAGGGGTGGESAMASSSSVSASSSQAASSGAGGAGGAPPMWPSCDGIPSGATTKTINQIWQDDPAQPESVWVPGVYVSAISSGGCVAGQPCQLFVQQKESFPSLGAGAQQALKVFVSANGAAHFTSIQVGDKVDLAGYAARDPMTNELSVAVTLKYLGCAKSTGTGTLVPVPVALAELTVDAYEKTLGPLFVEVSTVSGKPQTPSEIFALWSTGVFNDAGVDTVTNLSPYFLSGGVFAGLSQGKVTDFGHIDGVFAIVPIGSPPTKYEVLYPRSASDLPITKVHP